MNNIPENRTKNQIHKKVTHIIMYSIYTVSTTAKRFSLLGE